MDNNVRNIRIFIMTWAASLLAACSVADVLDVSGNAGFNEYPVSLVAGCRPDTRLSVEGLSMQWDSQDKVRILAYASDGTVASSELTVYSVDEENPGYASFTGFVTMGSLPQTCFFTYPSKGAVISVNPDDRKITAHYTNQSGKHEPYMYVLADYDSYGIYAEMKHLGAVLEFSVEMDGVSQISFVGNSLERLSPVTYDIDTGESTFSSELGLQITVPVQESGKTYMSVPPVSLEKGFSLILSKDDGSYMVKTYSADGSLSGGYDFSDKIGHIIPIAISGDFESFSISSSEPEVTHTKNGDLLSGTSVTFEMSKYGASDKLIEEWGATLLDPDGNLVRSVEYTNENPVSGEEVTMDVHDGFALLPEGTYTFTPYYKMYGQKVSLNSRTVTVADPGVRLILSGQTSYDKYCNGDTDGANSHSRNIIEGVSMSTNVDPGIISSYSVTLNDEDLGSGDITSDSMVSAGYGNITKDAIGSYRLKGSLSVGNLIFTAEKMLHITGLPLEADFTKANPNEIIPAWGMIGSTYKDARVVFQGSDALRSPAFHIPSAEGIKVKTACDSRHNVTSWFRPSTTNMNIAVCADGAKAVKTGAALTFGTDYYDNKGGFDNVSGFTSKGYLSCTTIFTLTSSTPSLMYNTTLDTSILGSNTFVSFRHKIEYANK